MQISMSKKILVNDNLFYIFKPIFTSLSCFIFHKRMDMYKIIYLMCALYKLVFANVNNWAEYMYDRYSGN